MKNKHKIIHRSNFAPQDNQSIQTSRELVFCDVCCLMASSSFKLLCWSKVQKLNKLYSLLSELCEVNVVQKNVLNGPTCHWTQTILCHGIQAIGCCCLFWQWVRFHTCLTLSNPIFPPTAYLPRNRKSTTCAICWLKSVLHEETCRTGSDSGAGAQTQQKKCRTSPDIGAEEENHNVGRGPT